MARTLEIGLVCCVSFAVIFFGGVYSWALMPLCAAVFLLIAFCPEAVLKNPLPQHLKLILLLLLAFIFYQKLFVSLSPSSTGTELLKWTAFWGVFFLVQALPRPAVFRLPAALAVLGVLEIIYGFYQLQTGAEKVLWQSKTVHIGSLTGTYLNRNHLAGLLELGLGPALGFWFQALFKREVKTAFAWGAGLFILLAGLFLTGSRMGAAGFFCASLLLFPFLLKKMGRAGLVLFGGMGVFAAAAFWAAWPVIHLRLEFLSEHAGNWEGGRWQVWKNTARMVRDYPWTGIGLGSFPWVFPAYQSEKLMMGWSHAHNDYLELFAGLGLLGFSLLAAVFFSLAKIFFSRWDKTDFISFLFVWGSAVSILSFLLHGLADFNFSIPANAVAFTLVAGSAFRLLELSGDAHV